MIPFNKAVYLPEALGYVADVVKEGKIAGDGKYTKLCSNWMEERFRLKKVLLTTSCTAALEMAAILLDIQGGGRSDYAIIYICIDSKCLCCPRR